MKKSRFSEAQMIGVLREQEAGAATEDVCRRHGISQQTFYRWKSKYGGMEISDAQKLKALEDENRRLKKLLAESMLDVAALKDLPGEKLTGPAVLRACGLVEADPKTVRHAPEPGDAQVRGRLGGVDKVSDPQSD
jgi:putative transposase